MGAYKPNSGVYVDLDVLFDTRLGTLKQIHPDLAIKVLDDKYFQRNVDEFYKLDKARFKFFYDNRDFETLELSLPTKARQFIRELCLKMVGMKIGTPHDAGAKLYINVYPYTVSKEFVTKLLNSFIEYTDGFVDIEIINKSLEHLTPGYCKNTFAAILMYDSSNWLDTHAKSGEFKTCKIPEITLYIPSIYFGTPPSATIIEEYKKKRISPFREFEISCSPYIGVNVIDTELFCIDVDLVLKSEQNQ